MSGETKSKEIRSLWNEYFPEVYKIISGVNKKTSSIRHFHVSVGALRKANCNFFYFSFFLGELL